MRNAILKINCACILCAVCFIALFFGASVFAAQPPIANAGPDLYVNSGQSITLQGSGYDPQSSILTYYWNCSGGSLTSSTIAQPNYSAPNSNQSYTCSLTVTNTYGLSASDNIIIYVSSNSGSFSVQTNSPTYIQNNGATLNGYVTIDNSYSASTYVYFQYGTDTNYANSSFQQTLNYSGSFFQNLASLSPNTTYHFRAVAQSNGYTIYGQDMTFNSNGSNYYYGSGSLSITKQVINLTSGNLNWSSSVSAKPGDVLSFAITLQAGNQDIHNVVARDILPVNLSYKGNLVVNGFLNYSGSPTSGINLGTIPANGIDVIGYQVQVAPATSFTYGATTLNNNATITSTEVGNQTASATVMVNNSLVSGASTVSTGLTNNPIADSFFLPLLIVIFGLWFYFSKNAYKFADWILHISS